MRRQFHRSVWTQSAVIRHPVRQGVYLTNETKTCLLFHRDGCYFIDQRGHFDPPITVARIREALLRRVHVYTILLVR